MSAKSGRWPSKEEIAASMEGLSVESFGGQAHMRTDHVAEEIFFGGLATHDNPYDVCTLAETMSFEAKVLQKPPGANFWKWLETTTFPA